MTRRTRLNRSLNTVDAASQFVTSTRSDYLAASLARTRLARPAATWLTTFGSGHGYTTAGGALASSNLNDTSDSYLGTQCATLTTNGAGTSSAQLLKTTGITLDLTGKDPVVALKISDTTAYSYLTIYLGSDSAFTNNYSWNIGQDAPRPPYLTSGDWVLVTLPWSKVTIAGTPTRSAITAIRFVAGDLAAPLTFKVGAFGTMPSPTRFPNGVVALTFDDSYASQWNVAWQKMAPLGLRGTLFPILGSLDIGSGFLTTQQVRTMHDIGGWEVGAHATTSDTHALGVVAMSADQRATEFSTLRAFLQNNGFEADSYAYPLNLYDSASAKDVVLRFTSGRTGYQSYETYPIGARERLRVFSGADSVNTLAAQKVVIDKVKANASAAVFVFHDFVASPSGGLQTATATFTALIDYIIAQGVAVVPQRELTLLP